MTVNKHVTAEQMITFMKEMENGQRIEFLKYLFLNNFDSRVNIDMVLATRNHIEDYLERTLTKEEMKIIELAYETGYQRGIKDGVEKLLKGNDKKG